MRLFVAVPLAERVKHELAAVCAKLRLRQRELRWSAAESWHITLQFLGSTSAEQLACMMTRLRAVQAESFPIALQGLGTFERAGVFFAEVGMNAQLAGLQRQVTAATAGCGFTAEEREYRPHITLARAGRGDRQDLRKLQNILREEPRFTRFHAREFCIYESFPGPGGSRYEVRERFELGTAQE